MDLGIQFIKPDFLRRDQSLVVSLNAVKQSLDAYDLYLRGRNVARGRRDAKTLGDELPTYQRSTAVWICRWLYGG